MGQDGKDVLGISYSRSESSFIQNGFIFIRDFSQESYHEQVRGVHLTVQINWHPMRKAAAAGPLKGILSDSENMLHMCTCESFPCCCLGANLQRVCLARLIASPEYSSVCKIFQTTQLLMFFHISFPLRNRDL